MQKKGEKILRLCAEIECATTVNEANDLILELLGVVAGNSKYSYDIDKAIESFLEKSKDYTMQKISFGALK